nr:ribonuclease H-like domain-containing protein [Tanacetum cinerariifolium]
MSEEVSIKGRNSIPTRKSLKGKDKFILLNATSFAAKSYNVNKRSNNASNSRGSINFNNNRRPSPNLVCKSYGMIGHTIERCYELIGMFDVIYISSLNITVGHPNETLAIISHVDNLKLTNNIVLYDVLVVHGYCVSLLSVNKLIKDSKLFVGFDKDTCYMQYLKKETVLDNGSESGRLYLINMDNDRVKKTKEPFPLSYHKSEKLGELIYLDLWGFYKAAIFYLKRKLTSFSSKGNLQSVPNVLPNQPTPTIEIKRDYPSVRWSSRPSKLPAKLNDYVVDSKLKYGIEKHNNYAKLNYINYYFTTTLNKSVELVTYYEAIKDNSWIEAKNNEIEALNRNTT